MKKILILFGGPSYEHIISCKSAKTIIENIDQEKYTFEVAGIDKQNNWYIFNDNPNLLLQENWLNSNIIKIDNIITYLKKFDKVFPIIHGSPEENGNIQGLFNIFNIKYIGSDILPSIISYDKELTKIILSKYNIPIIPYITLTKYIKLKKFNLPFPVIIKPARCGSSIGINIAKNIKELNKYTKLAFNYDNKVIIEQYIKSRELECAILETKKLIVSPVGEIKSNNTFYDYESKYIKESNLLIPAKISKKLTQEIQSLSLKIFKILSLKSLSRIDFLYDYNQHKLYFNEINTMPGFTSISMYPQLFNHINISTKELITKLIDN